MTQTSVQRTVLYFEKEGRHNLEGTILAVRACALEQGIGIVVVFTADGTGALQVCEQFEGTSVSVIAASVSPAAPPVGMASNARRLGLAAETREELRRKKIPLIEGNLPFEDIVIPEAFDRVLLALRNTLACISGGFPLCMQAVLMACEAGYVEPGATVIGMASDTAIVARASRKAWMFAPFGLEVKEIICKPRNLTVTRKSLYEEEAPSQGEG